MKIKGHFDGRSIVLDEPAVLAVGQEVRILFEPVSTLYGIAADLLIAGEPPDERKALNIDPAERVPADFVRQIPIRTGEIVIAEDFDDTPEDFKEYL